LERHFSVNFFKILFLVQFCYFFCTELDVDDISVMYKTLSTSMTNISIASRPMSTLSGVSPDTWQTASGKFIGKILVHSAVDISSITNIL